MKNDKGFSLLELIVVIAIMMVLLVMTVWGLSSVTNQKAKKAVSLIDGLLSQTQTSAMTTNQAYCQLSVDEDDNYIAILQDGTTKNLGDSGITIEYQTDASTSWTKISAEMPLILSFVKTSGAFLPRITEITDIGYVYDTIKGEDNSDVSVYVTKIRVKRGSYEKEIKLYPKTGKHQAE